MERPDTTDPDTFESSTSVDLPARTVSRVEARLQRSEFDTVEGYVTYVLEEVLGRVEDTEESEAVDTAERQEIEARLESLGYLD